MKILWFIMFCLAINVLHGQSLPEPVLQKAANIEDLLALSSDDCWSATYSRDERQLTIWNIKAGKIYNRYPYSGDIHFARFLPGNNYLLINLEEKLDIHSGRIIKKTLYPGATSAQLNIRSEYSNDLGEYLPVVTVKGSGTDSLVEKFFANQYKAYVISSDSSKLWGFVRGYTDQNVYEYDVRSGLAVRAITSDQGDIGGVTLDEEERFLGINSSGGTAIYELSTGKFQKLDHDLINLRISKGAQYVSGVYIEEKKTSYQVWKMLPAPKIVLNIPVRSNDERIRGVFKGTDTIMILSEYYNKDEASYAAVWTLHDAKEIFRLGGFREYAIMGNGRYLWANIVSDTRVFDMNSLKEVLKGNFRDRLIKISPKGNYLVACVGAPDTSQATIYQLPSLKKLDVDLTKYYKKLGRKYTFEVDIAFSGNEEEFVMYKNSSHDAFRVKIKDFIVDSFNLVPVPFGNHIINYSGADQYIVDQWYRDIVPYSAERLSPLTIVDSRKQLIQFISPSAERVFSVQKSTGTGQCFLYVGHTLTDTVYSWPLSGEPKAITANSSGTEIAYVTRKEHEYNIYNQVVRMSTVDGKVIDSVEFPENDVYNGKLTFDAHDRSIYVGWDKLYKWERGGGQLMPIQLNRPGRFFPIAENISGNYLFTFLLSPKEDSVSLAVISTNKHEIKFLRPNRISHFWLKDLSTYQNSSDPFIFEYQQEGGEWYLSARNAELTPIRSVDYNGKISNDGRKIFTYNYKGFRSFDAHTHRMLATVSLNTFNTLSFTPNRRYAYYNDDSGGDQLIIYDVAKGFRKVPYLKTEGKQGRYVFFDRQGISYMQRMSLSDSGTYMSILDSYQEGIAKVYEFPSGKIVFKHKMPYLLSPKKGNADDYISLSISLISPDEKKFIFDTYKRFLIRADLASGRIEQLKYTADRLGPITCSRDGGLIVAAEANYDAGKVRLYLWDRNGQVKEITLPMQFPDFNNFEIRMYEDISLLSVKKTNGLYFYSLDNLQLKHQFIGPDIRWYDFDAATRVFKMNIGNRYHAYNMPSFAEIPYEISNGYRIGEKNGFQTIFQDTIPLAYFVMDRWNEQMIWLTPSGYYSLNKASAGAIGFRYRENVYPASVFDAVYNRPDTVFSIIKSFFPFGEKTIATYRAAYGKRIAKSVQIPQEKELPVVTLAIADEVPDGQKEITAHIEAASNSSALSALQIKINGVPLYGRTGKVIAGTKFSGEVKVPILAGSNEIEATVIDNQGYGSLPAIQNIFQRDTSAYQPTVYFIGMGVSKYSDSLHNLKFADDDIINMSRLLKLKCSRLKIDTLIDANATRKNILSLRQTLMNTRAEDKVILFYCGHGIRKNGYYLGTHDIDFSNPAGNGLAVDELYGMVDSIPALARLIMLDACHSGQDYSDSSVKLLNEPALAPGVTMYPGVRGVGVENQSGSTAEIADIIDEMFADYGNEYGVNVIASSKANEYAFETPKLKDGVFTYALINAISTDMDGRTDGRAIRIKELKEYVSEMVLQMTGGRQRPTSRNENTKMDWELW